MNLKLDRVRTKPFTYPAYLGVKTEFTAFDKQKDITVICKRSE